MPKIKEKLNITITAPNFKQIPVEVYGTTPFVQCRFTETAMQQMEERQKAGGQAKKNRTKKPKDFEKLYKEAPHRSTDGWYGIPCGGIRNSLIDACRVVDFTMVMAKMCLFVHADGFSADGTPLVRIKGKPEMCVHPVKNASGVADLRVRAMWKEWSATVRLSYDADRFEPADVVNLMQRAGIQVGWGHGRALSEKSAGVGWGEFRVKETKK